MYKGQTWTQVDTMCIVYETNDVCGYRKLSNIRSARRATADENNNTLKVTEHLPPSYTCKTNSVSGNWLSIGSFPRT